MTTVSTAAAVTPTRVHDTRTFRRVGAAALMPLGPLTIAVVRLILPYLTTDSSPAVLRKISAAPGRQSAVVWLSLVLVFTLVPSALAAGRVLIRRSPILATLGWILVMPGFISLLFVEGDPTYRALIGIDPTAGAKVIDTMNAMGVTTIGDNAFVLGHIVGIILLGVAALRTRAIPRFAAWALIASQPLHAIFAVFVPNHGLDFCAWLLTTIGFAFLARAALRMSNDEWDLPPIGPAA